MYVASTQLIEGLVLGLTAQQRWKAAGQFNTSFAVNPLFVIGGALVVVTLIIVLIVINIRKREKPVERNNAYFLDQAAKRGLSYREAQILLHIARLAGLKRVEAVFTMGRAFDIGSARLTGPNSAMTMTAEQNKWLVMELSHLREKLGFAKTAVSASNTATASSPQKTGSRSIPVGKTVQMTRRFNNTSMDIEATIIKNDESALTVKLDIPVGAVIGQMWRIRYYYGASVWEFDVLVRGCDGDTLVLSHSDDIRFINRRRFLRVSVYRKAYVAPFSFERQVPQNGDKPESVESDDAFDSGAALPQFVQGAVTELAGPGLRIETPIEFKPGQRVAVVFDLGIYETKENSSGSSTEIKTTEVVEDIGIVRHVKALEKGWSVAVELTGLSDSNVDKLVRLTNAEAVKANQQTKNTDEVKTQEPQPAQEVPSKGQ